MSRKSVSMTRAQAKGIRWAIGYLMENDVEGGDHESVSASEWAALVRVDDAIADAFGWRRTYKATAEGRAEG